MSEETKQQELEEAISSPSSVRFRSVNDYESKEALQQALLQAVDPDCGGAVGIVRIDVEDAIPPMIKTVDYSDRVPACDWILSNYDVDTTVVQSMKEELERLLVLKSYLILDTQEREETFDRLTNLGQRIFQVPVCIVGLMDLGRQWLLSSQGMGGLKEAPRKVAFCAHTIQLKHQQSLIVPDATLDKRFYDHPAVTGPAHIRFYAGAPLISPEGYKLGTFCLVDYEPRSFSAADEASLVDLAALTVKAMVDRRNLKREDPARLIAYTAHDLMTPLTGVQLSLSLLAEDPEVEQRLNPEQMELLTTATTCSDIMIRICETAIADLRQTNRNTNHAASFDATASPQQQQQQVTHMVDLVRSLQKILEPIPKQVPLIISLDPTIPPSIYADDLKLFRSALNLVSNALERTTAGHVHLKITSTKSGTTSSEDASCLLVECEDTGPDLEDSPYLFQQTSMEANRLGLTSVAHLVESQGGQYGFRRVVCSEEEFKVEEGSTTEESQQGSVLWFRVPLVAAPSDETLPTTIATNNLSLTSPLSTSTKKNIHRIRVVRRQHQRHRSGDAPVFLRTCRSSSSLSSMMVRTDSGSALSSLSTEKNQWEGERLSVTPSRNTWSDKDSGCNQSHNDPMSTSPISDASSSTITHPTKSPCSEPRERRALVIEDSMVVRKSLARALDKAGFVVKQAVNGLDGLALLKETLFDLVLCDFLMPVMDGMDCVQQYRAWESENRPYFSQYIVGISAHVSVEDSKQGIQAGMDDFRSKPISIKTLAELQTSGAAQKRARQLDEMEGFTNGKRKENVLETSLKAALQLSCSRALESNIKPIFVGHQHRATKSFHDKNTIFPKPRRSNKEDLLPRHVPFCLIVMDATSVWPEDIFKVLKNNGWNITTAQGGSEGLRLLQQRNWDAVLIDDRIPAMQCIHVFREWEAVNRINEQGNVFYVCDGNIPNPFDTHSVVQPPFGFNGVLRKPLVWTELNYLMDKRSCKLNILLRKSNGTACFS